MEPLVNGKSILPDEITLKFIKDTANTVYIMDKYFKDFNIEMGAMYLNAVKKYDINELFIKFLFEELEVSDLKRLGEYVKYITSI
ncbi:MAG: hypothetical protein E7214_07605 [Clostridium sp.]|nr:hypothetical protein [Clostridium sp.]